MCAPQLIEMMDYLCNELNYKIYKKFRFFVEHALPKLVHHTLCEIKYVVHQHLVASSAGNGQRCILP